MEKIKEYLKNRIEELKEADAIACRNRWDMSKPTNERNIWREQSNEIAARRQELDEVLKQIEIITPKIQNSSVCPNCGVELRIEVKELPNSEILKILGIKNE